MGVLISLLCFLAPSSELDDAVVMLTMVVHYRVDHTLRSQDDQSLIDAREPVCFVWLF